MDQYLRTGRIDELVNNIINLQTQYKRSAQSLNLSDVRPLRALPTSSLRQVPFRLSCHVMLPNNGAPSIIVLRCIAMFPAIVLHALC